MSVSDTEEPEWPCTCPLVKEGTQASQPVLSAGIWEWHQLGLEAPLALLWGILATLSVPSPPPPPCTNTTLGSSLFSPLVRPGAPV